VYVHLRNFANGFEPLFRNLPGHKHVREMLNRFSTVLWNLAV